ncbi:DUF1206 domain-containing protein [Rhodoligotrophos defluvii]|uniref:DUF1206 domain-containing protein n=1 Tax=Rhodoligotrophos defluvii TaxID=2561934 RepID=UPI001EF0B7C5|nr:DUF1206 domain-containing protein [Rhodoligotrophos defluvii]
MSNRFEALARWGYAARGVVYLLLGALALSSVFWGGGQKPSSEGAFTTLLGQPFGRILLAAVAIGLVGHVLWRLAVALLNADRHDGDAKGYLARAGNLAGGVINAFLAFLAGRLALGAGGGSGGGSQGEDSIAAWLMQQPFGPWLVGLVGVVIIIAGIVQVWRGISGQYRKRVRLPAQHEALLSAVCSFGLAARGVLIAVAGGFFVYAAFAVDAEQAGGVTDALDWVHQLPFGIWLYGLAALGLVAFGAYSFIEARYREVNAPRTEDVKRAAGRAVS